MRETSEQPKPAVRCTGLLAELEAELRSTIADEHRFKKGSPSAVWTEGYKDGLRKAIEAQRRYSANSPQPPKIPPFAPSHGSAAKCENCGEPATHTGEFSEGNESGGRVPLCWRCAVTHRCHGVLRLPPNVRDQRPADER